MSTPADSPNNRTNVVPAEVLKRKRHDLALSLRARTTILGGEERQPIEPTGVSALKRTGVAPA